MSPEVRLFPDTAGSPEVGDSPLDILGLTSDAFADAARFAVGKGHGIATRLYPQVMDAGRFALEDFTIAADSATAWRKHFSVNLLEIASVVEEPGEFGTTAKAILKTHDGYEVECVRIPMRRSGSPEVLREQRAIVTMKPVMNR